MKNRTEIINDGLTADWLRDNGITVRVFNTTDNKLLQAQKTAYTLLTQNLNLLTPEQISTLQAFTKRVHSKHTRAKLKPKHAFPILNIATKINRQLFKQYKQTGT